MRRQVHDSASFDCLAYPMIEPHEEDANEECLRLFDKLGHNAVPHDAERFGIYHFPFDRLFAVEGMTLIKDLDLFSRSCVPLRAQKRYGTSSS